MDDDEGALDDVFASGHRACGSQAPKISNTGAIRLRRAIFCEVSRMTRLTANGTRSPIGAFNLSEQDRTTHRKWTRAWAVAYSAVIIALLAIGFVTRHGDDAQTARRSQPVSFNALPAEAPHPIG
jgi:hypothetical protein